MRECRKSREDFFCLQFNAMERGRTWWMKWTKDRMEINHRMIEDIGPMQKKKLILWHATWRDWQLCQFMYRPFEEKLHKSDLKFHLFLNIFLCLPHHNIYLLMLFYLWHCVYFIFSFIGVTVLLSLCEVWICVRQMQKSWVVNFSLLPIH